MIYGSCERCFSIDSMALASFFCAVQLSKCSPLFLKSWHTSKLPNRSRLRLMVKV